MRGMDLHRKRGASEKHLRLKVTQLEPYEQDILGK